MDDFTFLILAAFILIYMILAAVFESTTAPIVLMFTIPLAAIGSLLALLFTSNSLMNANVFVGFIILIGIVVNNSIILIDYTSLLRRTGNRKQRAIITAGLSRLRPILITAITTIVAMIPLAMGQGEYVSGLGAPFAITVIGGLTMSTLLTLVIIPTLYSGMEDALYRLRTQSLFMKLLQIVLFVVAVTCVYFWTYTLLNRILYVILTVILVPGVTWFLEDSLRRRKVISSRLTKSWKSRYAILSKCTDARHVSTGMDFRFEDSGTSRPARKLSRMAGYATSVVVVTRAGIHVLLHV